MRPSSARLGLGACAGAVTLVAAWGLNPIAGAWWFANSLVVVGIVVLTGAVMRASRLPLPVEPAGTAAGLLWALALVHAPQTMRWAVIPTGDTLPALRQLLSSGRDDAWDAIAPAAHTPGLALLVVGAIGVVAVVVDTLVVGLDLPGLALVPLGALYVAPWVIGVGFPPWWSFLLTAGGWLVLLAAHPGERSDPTPSPRARRGGLVSALVTSSAAAACALLLAALVPPAEVTLVEPTGSGTGLRFDPRVSLRRTLTTQSDTVALRYTSTASNPDYLRLAVLTHFDGREWEPGPAAEGPAPLRDDGSAVTYQLSIAALEGSAVPSPAGTAEVRTSVLTNWDPWLGVPVRTDGSTVRGSSAQVFVTPPNPTPEQLAAPNNAPGEFSADPSYLIGARLGTLARQVTREADTDLERARSLQEWFTEAGGFRYSLEVPPASGRGDLDRFLDERTGYCEQFAATMALMARTLGIPARVVVGFTQGTFQGGDWIVRGENAHAWPELWLGSAGWLRFEPTPRGSVDVPDYSTAGGAVTDQAEETVEPSPQATASSQPRPDRSEDATDLAPAPLADTPRLPAWVLGLAALLGTAALAPGVIRYSRHRRRLRRAHVGAAEAYDEVVNTLVDLRVGAAGATPRVTGDLIVATLAAGQADPALTTRATSATARIVAEVENEWYARSTAPTLADSTDVATVAKALRGSVNWRRRLIGRWWPASLWQRSAGDSVDSPDEGDLSA